MFLRRKKSKRKPKPFRRYDANYSDSISTFEWFIFVCLIVCNCVIIYGIIKALMI